MRCQTAKSSMKITSNSHTCLRSRRIVTYSQRSPLANVGLCHHLPEFRCSTLLMWCLLPTSGLLESQTAHLDGSEGLQNVSGPCTPHVAFTWISAFAATLNIGGNRLLFFKTEAGIKKQKVPASDRGDDEGECVARDNTRGNIFSS